MPASVAHARSTHDANLQSTVCPGKRLRDEHPDLEIRRVVLEQDLKRELNGVAFLGHTSDDVALYDGADVASTKPAVRDIAGQDYVV